MVHVLEALAQDLHVQLRGTRHPVRVAFYPYTQVRSTIRLRDDTLHIRISDMLQDAPDAVMRGVIGVLLCRLYGLPETRLDASDVAAYKQHARADKVRTRRKGRGKKQLDSIGEHRSLLESFLRVSLDMDLHVPDAPKLGWSPTRSRRRFGHHDPDHDCIVISRVLDDAKVPAFVLDFVVYHELLHIVHPPIETGRRRNIHHRAFRDAEAKFPQRDEAEAWLQRLASKRLR